MYFGCNVSIQEETFRARCAFVRTVHYTPKRENKRCLAHGSRPLLLPTLSKRHIFLERRVLIGVLLGKPLADHGVRADSVKGVQSLWHRTATDPEPYEDV